MSPRARELAEKTDCPKCGMGLLYKMDDQLQIPKETPLDATEYEGVCPGCNTRLRFRHGPTIADESITVVDPDVLSTPEP